MAELGPVSQAILDYVNGALGYIGGYIMMAQISRKTGTSHSGPWFFRRLVALALEGRIEAKVYRTGDVVAITFRRLQDPD